jgi:SAM-dependent methyltransferase
LTNFSLLIASDVFTGLLLSSFQQAANHILRSQKSDTTVTTVPPKFVKSLFDDYSATFEKSLESLAYNVPGLILDAVKERQLDFSLTVDLGCGTGLLGPLLRPYTRFIIGVDLSPKMLVIAEQDKVGIYNHLYIGDMVLLLQLLEKRREKMEIVSPTRRKLSGGIIRELTSVAAEGFGGAFLGGWDGTGDTPILPYLVTAADVFGEIFFSVILLFLKLVSSLFLFFF